MIYVRSTLLFLLLVALTISCDEDTSVKPKIKVPVERITNTSLAKEKQLESVLDVAGFSNFSSKETKNGRTNGSGFEIDVENIIKIIQADSLHYTYTFQVEDDFQKNSFSNLIIEEIEEGYIGFILQYESTEKFTDLSNFTGTLRRFDLEGVLISEKKLINGLLDKDANSTSNGRTTQSSSDCVTDINLKDECTKWGYIYNYQNTQTIGYGCLKYETVIEITFGACPDSGDGGSGTGSGNTGGTYIPPSSGGGTSGGGSGGGGSGYNPADDPDAGNTITPIPPKPIVVIPEDQAYAQRVQSFKSGLTSEEAFFLKKNQSIANSIYTYLESQVDDSMPSTTTYPEGAVVFSKWAINYFMNHPGATWQQMIVAFLLVNDPAALLDIPCDQLPKWKTLAQNEASQNIKDKINQLDENADWFDDWAIQTLNGANGTIVNMDYFSVNVTTLPTNPTTGAPFTPEGFLDYFRRNINDFADGSTFSPYCETPAFCTQETALWNSANPTEAIIYIDIPGDDGVVVCSEYTSSYWYFMTLEAPGAGNHPVGGTRQFGFEANANGGYNFYVRGVDRFDSNIVENTLYLATLGENPFFGADALWASFQNKLKEFVNSKGGNAVINTPVKYRPDWEKVKDVLEGKRPVSDLGCK